MLSGFIPLIIAAVVAASPAPAPSPKALPALIINGVLFAGVEYDRGALVWRNLAITVTTARVMEWRALPAPVKAQYAQQMIDNYRLGTHYSGNVKLTFIDESNQTLDQYLWTPPTAAPAASASPHPA